MEWLQAKRAIVALAPTGTASGSSHTTPTTTFPEALSENDPRSPRKDSATNVGSRTNTL